MNKLSNCGISVIIAAYNAESYLRNCLDSVLKQTFADFEMIVVDDGSKDNTAVIIKEFQGLDKRVTGLIKENGGVTSAREAGVQVARGKYLFFLDSDDYIPDTALTDLYIAAENEDSDIVFGLFALTKGVRNKVYSVKDFGVISNLDYLKLLCTGRAPWQLCSKLIKRELYQIDSLVVPKNIAVGEDALTLFQLVMRAQKIAMVNKTVYYYVQRKTSVMHTRNVKLANDNLIAADLIVQQLENRYASELRLYGLALRLLFLIMAFQRGGTKVNRVLIRPVLEEYTKHQNVMGLFRFIKRVKVQIVINIYKWA